MAGLKVKRAGADEYGRTLKLLLTGDPGAGKSRLSSTFPNPFYANVEGGLMSVADRAVPYTDITSSEDLNALLQTLRQAPKQREAMLGVPVSTIVIDTLDAMQKLLIEERKRTEKKDAMAIADWGWLGDQLRLIVRNYRNLEMHVVFCCHLKSESDAESGQTFVKPALQGAMGDEIAQYVDVVGLLKASPLTVVRDGKAVKVLQRVIQTSPDVRHPWLKDRSGRLPVEYDVNLNSDGTNLLGVIFGGEPAAPSEVVLPAANVVAQARADAEKAKAAPRPKAATPAVIEVASPSQDEGQPAEEPLTQPTEASSEAETEPESPVEVVQQELNEIEVAKTQPLEVTGLHLVPQETPSPSQGVQGEQGRDVPSPDMICADCGNPIETEDQRDLSLIRFRRALCRSDFTAMKQAKKQ